MPFLPPETALLRRRVASRNGRRAGRILRELAGAAGSRERREALNALGAALRSSRGPDRESFLNGSGLRAWLASTEEALDLLASDASRMDLFERAAAGPWLPLLLPEGKLDAGFRGRARSLGRHLLSRSFRRLPILLAFHTPAGRSLGPFILDAREDGEEASAAGEIHLHNPVPVTLVVGAGARLELAGATAPGPARRRLPSLQLLDPSGGKGIRITQRDKAPSWRPREVIPGSGIAIGRRVRSVRGGDLRTGSPVRGLAERLGASLYLVRAAWPEALEEVLAHTEVVVPLAERNTVSYSLIERPGVSYINVKGKTLVDLADDLLHETAHHRLHGLEEIEGPLDRDEGETHYYSPWRRSLRPLHGILHAAYTFSYRAELLRRMADLPSGKALPRTLPRAWIRKEYRKELRMLRQSLQDLREANRLGLLTRAGDRLREAIRSRVAALPRAD